MLKGVKITDIAEACIGDKWHLNVVYDSHRLLSVL